jgi:signal peptidase II
MTENTGAAFGLLQGWTGALSVVAIAIIAAIVVSASRAGAIHPALMVAMGLVLGGALGNLYDRVTLGYVRDFIEIYGPHLQIGNTYYTFPVFNVADSGITVGVIIVMAILLFSKDERAPRQEGVMSSGL